ncbi:hypothetical protein LWI28_027235 [Acer negundo]|uniref:Isopropylmalate dehydrogenase-like domain-containing protein n=1 Tax=Acer negundo TaxID=4023 RepID=A0AAD5NFR4_ACENE|nr:hypothetical protein LWI28_027235 [Acer negundo]
MATHLLRRVLGSRSSQILSATSTNPNSALTVARAYSVENTPIRATLFPGDGIGPEIAESVKKVFTEADVHIDWDEHYVGTEIDPRTQSFLTWESLESVRRNKIGLKGLWQHQLEKTLSLSVKTQKGSTVDLNIKW